MFLCEDFGMLHFSNSFLVIVFSSMFVTRKYLNSSGIVCVFLEIKKRLFVYENNSRYILDEETNIYRSLLKIVVSVLYNIEKKIINRGCLCYAQRKDENHFVDSKEIHRNVNNIEKSRSYYKLDKVLM